ncbi:MAG: sugar phosphate isomerase/epimerase [Balneolales bacterium]
MKLKILINGLILLIISSCTTLNSQSDVKQAQKQSLAQPGVVSYTFRHQFDEDIPGTLDIIKEMGITNIEFSNLFGATSQELRNMLDERGLVCTSYGVGYNDLVNNPEQVAKDAHNLGAKFVRTAWIPHDSPFTIEDAERTVADFNSAGRALNEEGLMFAYHNHGFEFRPYGDGTLFDYIVTNTNPDYVGFEMDLLWTTYPGQDPVALLEKYPERFKLMHYKDLKKGVVGDLSGGAPDEYDVPLGTGQVDFPAVIEAARNTAIENFYIEDETDDVITRVPKSREFIMSLTQ